MFVLISNNITGVHWPKHVFMCINIPHTCARGKLNNQFVCLSVVNVVIVIGTKIARSQVLGICACFKHNESIDIDKKWFLHASNCWKWPTRATKSAFSLQHACGLLITPALLACTDATAHAQAQCRKGSSSHSSSALCYSGYRARRVCALESSSFSWSLSTCMLFLVGINVYQSIPDVHNMSLWPLSTCFNLLLEFLPN